MKLFDYVWTNDGIDLRFALDAAVQQSLRDGVKTRAEELKVFPAPEKTPEELQQERLGALVSDARAKLEAARQERQASEEAYVVALKTGKDLDGAESALKQSEDKVATLARRVELQEKEFQAGKRTSGNARDYARAKAGKDHRAKLRERLDAVNADLVASLDQDKLAEFLALLVASFEPS